MDEQVLPIANDPGYGRGLYRMWAGAYGDVILYVFADDFEDAFEELVEWLDDHAPECLTTVSVDDYRAAALELGLKEDEWSMDDEQVREHAEADLTMIGHTTLKNGTHIASWEWGGDEVDCNSVEWHAVALRLDAADEVAS